MSASAPVRKSAKCPACGALVDLSAAAGTVTCTCGRTFAIKAPGGSSSGLAERAAAYGARRSRAAEQEAPQASAWTEWWFPLILIVGGTAIWIAQTIWRPLAPSIATGLVLSFVLLVVGVVIMFGGVLLAAKILGADFGDFHKAIFKLCATALFADAVFAITASLDLHSGRGPIVGWHAAILIYLIAFKTMFDLDWLEALTTTGIVGVLQALAALVILQAG
jgi:hypothetical protein